jgi:dihydrofolate synthase/folylpolyglutamate synthase
MMARSLADWLTHAERVHPVGIDLGLHRVRLVAARLGVLPPAATNVVIAGTNGKGSTAVYLEGLLRAGGRTVGTTLSPHLNRFNERVRVNGHPVGDEVLCGVFAAIEDARCDTTLTYFEFGILAALLTFRRANVDATVLEVGLGGRLDAVNVVDADLTIITSIGIDHVEYLGSDRETIGAEKAGILRRGVTCVFGEPSIPVSVVNAAKALNAPLLRYGADFSARGSTAGWYFEGLCDGVGVSFDGLVRPSVAIRNAATALQALLALDGRSAVQEWVRDSADVRLPGRFECFEYRGAQVIVDVAHNPHGAAFLGEQLRSTNRSGRTLAIAGFLQDKDAAGIVAALDSAVDEWVFVGTDGQRGQDAAATASKAGLVSRASVAHGALVDILDGVVLRLTPLDRLVVLGSFGLAQRIRGILIREAPGRD